MITILQALQILKEHSIEPDQPTKWNPTTQQWIMKSTFFQEFGVHGYYNSKKIYNWLGY